MDGVLLLEGDGTEKHNKQEGLPFIALLTGSHYTHFNVSPPSLLYALFKKELNTNCKYNSVSWYFSLNITSQAFSNIMNTLYKCFNATTIFHCVA